MQRTAWPIVLTLSSLVACSAPSTDPSDTSALENEPTCIDVPFAMTPLRWIQNGNVNQGNVNQGNAVLGEDRGFVLHAMNGVALRTTEGSSPLLLHQGRLAVDSTDFEVDSAVGRFALHVDGIYESANYNEYKLSHANQPVCAEGERGIFIEGAWDEQGNHVPKPGTMTFSCSSGVIAKCVQWGYAPWIVGHELHQTCTRAARADYCGTGASWTRNGTTINLYDSLGVQVSTPSQSLSFEAGWGPAGAVCVSAPRFRISTPTGSVLPDCWSRLPRCASLPEAQTFGGYLANDSAHAPAAACIP